MPEIYGNTKVGEGTYISQGCVIGHPGKHEKALLVENRLDEVPGAGEAITKKITELVTTGKLGYYERLKAESPERTPSAQG